MVGRVATPGLEKFREKPKYDDRDPKSLYNSPNWNLCKGAGSDITFSYGPEGQELVDTPCLEGCDAVERGVTLA